MELKNGYKQTDIGAIPNDWNVREINVIGTINGRVGWKGYTKKDLRDSGALAIGAKHIDKENRLDLSDPTYLSNEKFIESPEIMVKINDMLIVQRGTIGKVVLIDKEIGEATINPSMLILRLSEVMPKFVYYYFVSASGQSQILNGTSSTGVPMITQKQVLNFKLPIPPTKSEQTAIATALSDADALITSIEKLIAKKRNIKQGAMQELLSGKRRLGGFVKREGFKKTENGEIPIDWDIRNFKEVSFMKGRIGWQGLKQTEFNMNGDDPFLITGMNFKDGEIRWNEVYHVSNDRYEIAKEIQLNSGDVLMTKDGTIGKILYVDRIPYPYKATLNSHLLVFRPLNDAYYPKYLYYHLSTTYFLIHIGLTKSGTTFFGLSQKSVGEYKIILPPLNEQIAIATALADIDDEIVIIERKLLKAKAIKQGMMQNLLTGKIRLT